MAQQLKLQQWLGESAAQEDGSSLPTGLEQVMRNLQLDNRDKQATAEPMGVVNGAGGGVTDPQVYLRGGSGVKFHDILDFIHMIPPLSKKHIISDKNGVQILHRSGPKKPKLQTISIEQWCLANTRIMDMLLTQDERDSTSLRDYMAYTIKVCQLFTAYDKITVLQYDREYIYLQSQYGFRWGTDAPHIHTVHLKVKTTTVGVSITRPYYPSSARGAVHSDQLCRLFNTREGCHYGTTCKFAHQCSQPGCKLAHSRLDHPQTTRSRELPVTMSN